MLFFHAQVLKAIERDSYFFLYLSRSIKRIFDSEI